MIKHYGLIAILALSLLACRDSDLLKVSKALLVTAKSIEQLQTDAIEANKLALISDDDTRVILELCIKASQAGKEATALTRAISKLEQPDRGKLLLILQPVVKSIDSCIQNGLSGIKNDATRQRFRLTLLGAQSALNTIQIILAGG
jgi:hypothetical protein